MRKAESKHLPPRMRNALSGKKGVSVVTLGTDPVEFRVYYHGLSVVHVRAGSDDQAAVTVNTNGNDHVSMIHLINQVLEAASVDVHLEKTKEGIKAVRGDQVRDFVDRTTYMGLFL